jgi:hypothetical protein
VGKLLDDASERRLACSVFERPITAARPFRKFPSALVQLVVAFVLDLPYHRLQPLLDANLIGLYRLLLCCLEPAHAQRRKRRPTTRHRPVPLFTPDESEEVARAIDTLKVDPLADYLEVLPVGDDAATGLKWLKPWLEAEVWSSQRFPMTLVRMSAQHRFCVYRTVRAVEDD